MKLLTIKMTPQQFEALREVERITGKNKSELVRSSIREICFNHGVSFPQNVAKRGKHKRK